ncbi:hypothetical protein TKK_0015048 [Trichogramma kaykai]|uniref:Uncharacterized protein n=1 Tax=Trichogramma kaykai TaxID=54128 RepID=A0ABD2WBR3_9HYME
MAIDIPISDDESNAKRCETTDGSDAKRRKIADDESGEKLKHLVENTNWEVEEERRELLKQLNTLIGDWSGPLPNLRDVFRKEEIDLLLIEFAQSFSPAELEKLVKFVISSGYEDEGSDSRGLRTTLLHRVVKLNHPPLYRDELIRDLFRIYNEFKINCLDEETGLTHLHVACMSGLDDVVKEFLEHGQDPNCFVAATEDSPLLLALKHGRKSVAELLLKSGALPNTDDNEGVTPLHVICETAAAESSNKENLPETFFEINDQKKQVVQVNAWNEEGCTPLQLAVTYLMPRVVALLLDRGADIDKFAFPDVSDLVEACTSRDDESSLRLVAGALAVCDILEAHGYAMKASDAQTIVEFFAEHELFKKTADIAERWYDCEEFVALADKVAIKPSVSLYLLIRTQPEEPEQVVSYLEFWEFAERLSVELPQPWRHMCALHLGKMISRTFFERWGLEPYDHIAPSDPSATRDGNIFRQRAQHKTNSS